MTFDEAMALEIAPGVTMGKATTRQLREHADLMERTGAALKAMSNAEFEQNREMRDAWREKLDKHHEASRVIKEGLQRRGVI